MTEEPLYQDEKLEIDYYPHSFDDHFLHIVVEPGKKLNYPIPRGIMAELARTPRGGIERKINAFNDSILFALREAGINVDGLHVALCQAYIEEEERIQSGMEELRGY